MFIETRLHWLGCRRSPSGYHPSRCIDDFFGAQDFTSHVVPVSNSVFRRVSVFPEILLSRKAVHDEQQKYIYFFILPILLLRRDKNTPSIFESPTRRFDANCIFYTRWFKYDRD